MKNYNIIFNGEVIQTITAFAFSRTESGQTQFYDKNRDVFCVIPKEYMFVETENLTKYQQVLQDVILNLESTMNNDRERELDDFKSLEFWKEEYRNNWRNYFQRLYVDTL